MIKLRQLDIGPAIYNLIMALNAFDSEADILEELEKVGMVDPIGDFIVDAIPEKDKYHEAFDVILSFIGELKEEDLESNKNFILTAIRRIIFIFLSFKKEPNKKDAFGYYCYHIAKVISKDSVSFFPEALSLEKKDNMVESDDYAESPIKDDETLEEEGLDNYDPDADIDEEDDTEDD